MAQNTGSPAIQFSSPAQRVTLLELYTSEGCSSCPPAEAWLSRNASAPGLWTRFVPVAFHVDYWDNLGWPDPWSQREFSNRQRNYAAHWVRNSVYTPGFVLNGDEWLGWRRSRSVPAPAEEMTGVLTVNSMDTNHWQVTFEAVHSAGGDCEVYAALLGCGLHSDVKAGENRGRRLEHDFVVQTLAHSNLARNGRQYEGEFALPLPRNSSEGRFALAVWISRKGRLDPLQATGGWFDPAQPPEQSRNHR